MELTDEQINYLSMMGFKPLVSEVTALPTAPSVMYMMQMFHSAKIQVLRVNQNLAHTTETQGLRVTALTVLSRIEAAYCRNCCCGLSGGCLKSGK